MVNDVALVFPAVGACLRCHQLFLAVDSSARCQFCGRPPDATLPFGPVQAVDVAPRLEFPAPTEEPGISVHVDITCPHCGEPFTVITADAHIFVIPPPPAPPADEAVTEPPSPAVAAPSPEETPTPPAMAHDVFGNPIEGPPAEPEASPAPPASGLYHDVRPPTLPTDVANSEETPA